VSIFPVLLDTCPPYARGLSLLRLPAGEETLLQRLTREVSAHTPLRPMLLPEFEPDEGYRGWAGANGIAGAGVLTETAFVDCLLELEPSDWLLLADPRSFAPGVLTDRQLVADLNQGLRCARHIVARESTVAGTRERVTLDRVGRVRRIQRYYDSVTWNHATGVAATLLPVSGLVYCRRLTLGSLTELRTTLSAAGVPSRDIVLPGHAFNLLDEDDLLSLNEELLVSASSAASRTTNGKRRSKVESSVRLLGPVVLHDGAKIEHGATVIGPTVIGSGAVIRAHATVAQAVIAEGVEVPGGAVVRQQVLAGGPISNSDRGGRRFSEAFGASGFTELYDERPSSAYRRVKAVAEAAISTMLLALLSPLLGLLALAVKLESRGPVFYGDMREGLNGRMFRCFKFRTMIPDAHSRQRELMRRNEVDGPQFKMQRDPRVTRVGRWLRATSLDELPQLYNVVRGEMSLVGPRPSPFRENQLCVPWREGRLSVRPGITGLWQVCRHDRSESDFHQWIDYDLQYVRHMSFWVDVKIVIATVLTLAGRGHVPIEWIVPSKRTGVYEPSV
jgi:lipopolysaccharide/colanic/teichoic acid biosynthesis glycosyltransferase